MTVLKHRRTADRKKQGISTGLVAIVMLLLFAFYANLDRKSVV